jgi:hypothetical protein
MNGNVKIEAPKQPVTSGTIHEPVCAECGHGKSCHQEQWGGICVGCPCSGFKPKLETLNPKKWKVLIRASVKVMLCVTHEAQE